MDKRTPLLVLAGTLVVIGAGIGWEKYKPTSANIEPTITVNPTVTIEDSEEYRIRLYNNPDCNNSDKEPDREIIITGAHNLTSRSDFPQRYLDTIDGFVYMHPDCEGPVHGSTDLIRYNPTTQALETVGRIGRMHSWYFPKVKKYVNTTSDLIIVYDLAENNVRSFTLHALKEGETFDKLCEMVCETNMDVTGDATLAYDVFAVTPPINDTLVPNKYLRREEINLLTGAVRVMQ